MKHLIRVGVLTAAWFFAVAKGYLPDALAGIFYLIGLAALAVVGCAEWVMAGDKDEAEQERQRELLRIERRKALLGKPTTD